MNPITMKTMCQALEELNNVLRDYKSGLSVRDSGSIFLEHGEEEVRVEIDYAGYFRLDLL